MRSYSDRCRWRNLTSLFNSWFKATAQRANTSPIRTLSSTAIETGPFRESLRYSGSMNRCSTQDSMASPTASAGNWSPEISFRSWACMLPPGAVSPARTARCREAIRRRTCRCAVDDHATDLGSHIDRGLHRAIGHNWFGPAGFEPVVRPETRRSGHCDDCLAGSGNDNPDGRLSPCTTTFQGRSNGNAEMRMTIAEVNTLSMSIACYLIRRRSEPRPKGSRITQHEGRNSLLSRFFDPVLERVSNQVDLSGSLRSRL